MCNATMTSDRTTSYSTSLVLSEHYYTATLIKVWDIWICFSVTVFIGWIHPTNLRTYCLEKVRLQNFVGDYWELVMQFQVKYKEKYEKERGKAMLDFETPLYVSAKEAQQLQSQVRS